jgi:hypothetical protein
MNSPKMARVMCARVAEIIIAKGVLLGVFPARKQEQPAQVAVVLLDTFPDRSSGGRCLKEKRNQGGVSGTVYCIGRNGKNCLWNFSKLATRIDRNVNFREEGIR